MKKIKINTTQNVVIEYEIAQLRERIIAFIIDFVVIFLVMTFLWWIYVSTMNTVLLFLFILPFFIFYSLVSEIFLNGQSAGKRAMDIQVVKINGTEAQFSDYILRWAFRILDIYFSLGILAVLFIRSSFNGQRLGDLVAETAVIKLKPYKKINFKDVTKIQSSENYHPLFPEVKKLSEENVLLIKTVYERYAKYPNKANQEVLRTMVSHLKEKLDVTQYQMSDMDFLKTLVKDYVVMTR
ncbi:MAG: RDD family protein [Microscillaceae bacterium]|nr:RDD family protein [Microscillaceae bacterium]